MGRKELVIICLLFTLVSCISFYHHPKGGFRPKKPKFSLAKEKFKYNKLIDTLAVYVNIDTIKYGNYKRISYLKFFGDGRFFKNSTKSNEEINIKNLIPGAVGYYNTTNNNTIITEHFSVDYYDKNNTQYIKQKGEIKNDTIFVKNNINKSYTETCVKQKLNFVPEPSNW